MISKQVYHSARRKYYPSKHNARLKLIVIAESPPVSGEYFYFENKGTVREPLFSAMAEVFLKEAPKEKYLGLAALASRGILLVDTIYEPVNQIKSPRHRKQKLLSAIPELIRDLKMLDPSGSAQILFIKKSVCRLVGPYLNNPRFKVINRLGKPEDEIPFPNNGHRPEFVDKLSQFRRTKRIKV